MSDDGFQIRTMSRADLDEAMAWAAAEGWNPGLHDADAFHAADPNGFLMGVLDGEPVASISVVRYDDDFGFLGFYIVKPEHRGAGYGMRIWNAGMRYLDGCNVGLDGVVEQQPNYRKSGFQYAYGNQRHQGTGGGTHPPRRGVGGVGGVVDAADVPLQWISDYDAPRFPASRAGFVANWLSMPGTRSFVIPGEHSITVYVVIRPCRQGFKIGPLFADDAGIAESLFRAASACAPGAPIFLDTPLPNAAALSLAERHDMTPVFETARMYTGPEPDIRMETVFGVTTFELG